MHTVRLSLPAFLMFLLVAACAPVNATGAFVATSAFPTPVTLSPPATRPSAGPVATPTLQNAIGPYTYPAGINPLTGLPLDDPARQSFRPMAVKISNAPPLVRPQAGIGQADVVFEHYTEGSLTRFTALFLSQLPRRVGSIRSARLIDVEIPEMFESYLVYSGASQGVRDRIEATAFAPRAFYGVEIGPPVYYRDPALPVPHNLFADLVAAHELAARLRVNTPPAPNYSALAFSPDPPPGGEPAERIDLGYAVSGVFYRYDAAAGVYWRWTDGEPHYDANTDRQLAAANVVVLYANHTLTDIVESEWQGSVSYSIEIQLWGEGRAVVFRDGLRYDGTWERPRAEEMFLLRTDDGAILCLRPGVTFFQLVPSDFSALSAE